MPNIKSAKKRDKQSKERRERNNARKNAIKTAVKRVIAAIADKDVTQAKELLKDVQAKLARAKGKRVLHKNTVARKMSRLAKRVAKETKPA